MDTEKINVNPIIEDEDEIDLLELFHYLLSKIVFIAIFFVVGAIVAMGITKFAIAPKYKATSKVYVVSASNESLVNLSDLQLGTSLTADYKELVMARPMLESCIEALDLDYTYGELGGMIEISNPSNTRILKITATSTKPEEAKDIANKMAELAVTWLPEVMESRTPHIAEDAITPLQKSSPSTTKNTLIGAVALAALYCAFECVRFLLDDTVATAEDFEKYFGMVPLSVVPEQGKEGKK